MDQAERQNTTWWTGIIYGLVALVLGWTFFASHLAGLLAGSWPRLVSLAEFADRLGHFGAFFALLALGVLLLIAVARYWFGEEMAQAAAQAALQLVKLAPAKIVWRWLLPVYRLVPGLAGVARLLVAPAPAMPGGGASPGRYRPSGTPLAKPILVVKTARPFFLFQAAPLLIP